jgi:prolyl oligopeptidase
MMESHGDWLVVKRRTEWTAGGSTFPPDTLLGISLPAFSCRCARLHGAFEPGDRRAPQGFFGATGR